VLTENPESLYLSSLTYNRSVLPHFPLSSRAKRKVFFLQDFIQLMITSMEAILSTIYSELVLPGRKE